MSLKMNTVSSYQKLILFASIVPLILFGFLIYNDSRIASMETTFEYIESLNEQNKKVVTRYFEDVEFNTKELAKTVSFLQEQATRNIVNIQELQKNHIKNYYLGIENNILSLAKKDVFKYIFNFLERGKKVNQVYLDNIYAYKEELNIKNVLMLDKQGKILYSSDDKTLLNLHAGDLTEAFQNTCKIAGKELTEIKVSFVHTSYSKTTGKHQRYAIAPFQGIDGYIAIEMSQENIHKIIQNVASLGKTAETYLVYEDEESEKTYLASNRVLKNGKIGDEIFDPIIDKGFSSTGTDIKYGSLGEIELVGYTPVNLNNITLSMQTTVAYTEIISPTINGSDYFEQFIRDYNYENVMLVGPNGDVFYSVVKDKEYKEISFTKEIEEAFKTKKFVLTDIIHYSSTSKKVAQFALFPILRKNQTVQSIVVVQLNLNTLSKQLAQTKHIYDSFETYLVGQDFKLRGNTLAIGSDYTIENSFENNIFIKTKATKNVFKNQSNTEVVTNYRGAKVLSSYDIIKSSNFKWAIVSEVQQEEIESMLDELKYTILTFVIISSLIALMVMFIITNEKKKQDKKIHYTANHDALTGLVNRKFVLEYLAFTLDNTTRRKKSGAVLFIDLDKFKFINDSYGHQVGDFVLQEIATRLKNLLRDDDLVGRLGGDEFIIIINKYARTSDIDTLCKKIIEEVAKPIKDQEKSYNVGISIGIATFPEDSYNAEELLQFSDTAMFSTKENGRNNFTYYSKQMTEKSLRISRVESELQDAINMNQLVLHYQPQVSLETAKVLGVEALVRWNHPLDGLIMPNDFIGIAEESNLILGLGYRVLYDACENFKKWKDNGSDLEYIAVNMSTKQLQSKKCIENIHAIIEALDFNPTWLELEITETTLMTNLEGILANIEYLKSLGIKFSIDDFGTGYSSLSYLKSLQISTLKIDREFIKDMLIDNNDRVIVEAIIVMGHTLGYTIVAEGAQTKGEAELLKYFACDIIQGNYYSKPLPEKELLAYIKEHNNAE